MDLAIEPGPTNSRCIWAGVDVAAPAGTCWRHVLLHSWRAAAAAGCVGWGCLRKRML